MDSKQIEIFTSVVYKEMCAKENTLYFNKSEKEKFFQNVTDHATALYLSVLKSQKAVLDLEKQIKK